MAKYRQSHVPKFSAVARSLSREVRRVADRQVLEFADTEMEAFKTRIERQAFASFDANPLTPRWYRKKLRKGADTRVMIATGHYIRSIRRFTRRDRHSMLVHIGFNKRMLARDLDGRIVPYPLYKIARVHEHGSTKMKVPARPHWKPHYGIMRVRARWLRARIRREIVLRMRREFGKLMK